MSVCPCVEARLQSFHSGVKRAKFVCMYVCVCVVPLGETEANSRKWIGMEGLARDSGVKMKEFFHTHRNSRSLSPPSLFLLQDALFISATWASLTHVHIQTKAWDMNNHTPTHSRPHKHTHTDKPKKISLNVYNLYVIITEKVLSILTLHLATGWKSFI